MKLRNLLVSMLLVLVAGAVSANAGCCGGGDCCEHGCCSTQIQA